MKVLCFALLFFLVLPAVAQKQAKAPFIHSHNDYLQNKPLVGALNAGAKSIEIDVFLHNNQLLVAHTKSELKQKNTLETLYILPLQQYLQENKSTHNFHFLIDIKSEPVSTLAEIQLTLERYPHIFSNEKVRVVISGNQTKPETFGKYAKYIWFDGRKPSDAVGIGGERIALISQNLSKFTRWRTIDKIPIKERNALQLFIEECHEQNKQVRFWNTGDSEEMYQFLCSMNVDYINTDYPKLVQQFLEKKYN